MASGVTPNNVGGVQRFLASRYLSAQPPASNPLLFAGIADQLETRDAQVAGFLGFCFLAFFPFHLSFSFLPLFFLGSPALVSW